MIKKPIQLISTFFLSVLLLCSLGLAHAAYPDKPIKIVIGFPAGGPLDAHIRLLIEKLQSSLGQTVIVDYKSGAGGTVGAQFVAQSPADGYTVLLANTGTMVINPAIYTKSQSETLNDFQPVARTAQHVRQAQALKLPKPAILAGFTLPVDAGDGQSIRRAARVARRVRLVRYFPARYRGCGLACPGLAR